MVLGKLALQLSRSSSSGSSSDDELNTDEIDREQMLSDVIEFAMHGFGGDTHGAVDA